MPITPTANISSKCSPNSKSPSRLPEYDPQSTASSPVHPSLPSHITPHLTSSQAPSRRSRPQQDVSTSRPTKRRRNMAVERASSSSDSSSQSGIADNETEPEPSHLSERSAPQVTVSPKKKRTRTLTTPHQSAVLHALLAKSRFPTTAMREEVGRQIGLSARKVQIWFQNQRQKARRPPIDSAPLTRPPQFGPFPIIAPAGPSSSSYPSPLTGAPVSEVSHSAPSSAQSAHDSAASLDSNPALSGPGIPSWSPSSYQRGPPSAEEWEPPRRPPTSPKTPLGNSQHPRLPQGISARDSRGSTRGLSPQSIQSAHVETSPQFSSVLPPIILSALEPRSSTESYVSATSSFPPQPASRIFVNIVQHHDFSALPAVEQGSPVRPGIPPPIVLQPQPQWDPQTFTPYTRPQFASWLQSAGSPLSSAGTTLSTVGTHDRVMHTLSPDVSRHRHTYPSLGEPHPPSHHIIPPPPSRNQRFSTSAPSSRASVSREGRARSDDEAGEE